MPVQTSECFMSNFPRLDGSVLREEVNRNASVEERAKSSGLADAGPL